MKSLLLLALTTISISAQAKVTCETVRINQWPHNPEVTVEKTEVLGLYKVAIVRPYYGFVGSTKFEAVVNGKAPGAISLENDESSLTLETAAQTNGFFNGLLVSTKYGAQALRCTGAL